MVEKIQKGLVLSKEEYYVKHLSIINPMLPQQLNKKEIEVLAAFLALDKAVVEDDYFNTLARKKVRVQLNLKPGGLSNYLRTMIEKGFLEKSDITSRITIQPYLIPNLTAQGYMFKIVKQQDEKIRKDDQTDRHSDPAFIS